MGRPAPTAAAKACSTRYDEASEGVDNEAERESGYLRGLLLAAAIVEEDICSAERL
jgi:hypothetical protein